MVMSRFELGFSERLRHNWEQYFGGVEVGGRGCVLSAA